MPVVVLKYAARNLLRTRLRSFFTLLSIILIVALYTVLASIAQSFTKQVSQLLLQQEIDIAVQARYASSPVTSKIPAELSNKIRLLDDVSSSESIFISRKKLKEDLSVFMLGVSDYNVFSSKLGFRLVKGEKLDDQKNQIVVGEKMANVLHLSIGDDLLLDKDNSFKIVGVFSSWLNFLNSGIVIHLSHAQRITDNPDQTSLMFLSLNDPTRTNSVITEINSKFPSMWAVDSLQFPDHIGPIKSFFYFSKVVSILTLLIAISVLLNTLNMAISERTKEVGILAAIGWSRWLIISVFLYESMILSLVGGIIGYLCAYPIMLILKNNFTSVYMYFPDAPDLTIFFNVLLICMVIAIISTMYPALHGTRIQVAKALHYE